MAMFDKKKKAEDQNPDEMQIRKEARDNLSAPDGMKQRMQEHPGTQGYQAGQKQDVNGNDLNDQIAMRRIKEALRQNMQNPMRENRATGGVDDPVMAAPVIGKKEISEAIKTLQKYKDGKTNLEERLVQDELWWELRHWETMRGKMATQPEPSSAWLFNTVQNKHADAMDNMPEPIILAREQSDEESANILSDVLPSILEYNGFRKTYASNWWEKLKHGTAAYGVFWNSEKENGIGDVDIRQVDLLKVFWEPGITELQKSRNLFVVDLVDVDLLEEQYPNFKGKLDGNVIDVKQYIYDDNVDTDGKSVVVDWYYRKRKPTGGLVLHYCKFVGDTLLYASENDRKCRETGWYEHGKYPIVFDTLYPEKGTPVGFGFVSICKDPQLYIDRLSANILETSMMATRKRFFVSGNTNVNEEEFADWTKPLVHVEGELDERRIKEITMEPLSSIYVEVQQMKIDEMKDTASNRDVNSGGVGAGVTAAAAISALQEAGNKVSRDMINASYLSYTEIVTMCLELVRQFYDEQRSFRIVLPNGANEYKNFSNEGIRQQAMPPAYPGADLLYRKPVFDIKIQAQKKNPFSRVEQNERAKELYQLGFFNPERAQEAMLALDMMEFEGVDKIRAKVAEGDTLINVCQKMAQQMDQMAAIIQITTGKDMGAIGAYPQNPMQQGAPQDQQAPAPKSGGVGKNRVSIGIMESQKATSTAYGDRLAKQASTNVAAGATGKK